MLVQLAYDWVPAWARLFIVSGVCIVLTVAFFRWLPKALDEALASWSQLKSRLKGARQSDGTITDRRTLRDRRSGLERRKHCMPVTIELRATSDRRSRERRRAPATIMLSPRRPDVLQGVQVGEGVPA
jgi:hypothetical protein